MQFLNPVNRLPNMEDTSSKLMKINSSVINHLTQLMELNGYESADTPIIEKSDLFLRKSGGNISSRLYQFTDPGGYDVCLRPEFTSAITRSILSKKDKKSSPFRLYYYGPVFRYSKPGEEFSDLPRQFNQFGAELIGSNNFIADSEITSIAYKIIKNLTKYDLKLIIGNVNIIASIANYFDVSERSKMYLLESVQDIKTFGVNYVLNNAIKIGLFDNNKISKDYDINEIKISIDNLKSKDLFSNTSRTTKEIIKRINIKNNQSYDKKLFEKVLKIIYETILINGNSDNVLEKIYTLWKKHKIPINPINDFYDYIKYVSIMGVPKKDIFIDFGLVKHVSYYSGIIFNVCSKNDNVILGGGGRYDGLSRDLGFNDIAARGFAFDLNKIISVSDIKIKTSTPIVIRSMDKSDFSNAIKHSEDLKSKGIACQIDYDENISDKGKKIIYVKPDGSIKESKL